MSIGGGVLARRKATELITAVKIHDNKHCLYQVFSRFLLAVDCFPHHSLQEL